MATTFSRARRLRIYARHGANDAVEVDNVKVLINRINWDELREFYPEDYAATLEAVDILGMQDVLARVLPVR